MPMDEIVISKIKEIIISQSDYYIDFMTTSIREKIKDLTNPSEIFLILNDIWYQYQSNPTLINILIQFYLEKSAFNEVLFIFKLIKAFFS